MEMFHYNTNPEANRNGKELSNSVYILAECINHYNLIALGVHLLKIKKSFKANHNALSQHF
jgi:hypothetical protein